jgi:hypothetical protein
MQWSMQGYTTALGFFVWPIIFIGVITYVYLKNQSVVAASIAILIIVTAFSDTFIDVPALYTFLHVLVALIIAGLFLVFFTKMRR